MSIKKREYVTIMYFVSRALFLGVGYSYMYKSSGKDAWIAIIMGYLIGNIIIYLYDKFAKKINYNLNNLFDKKSIISKIYKFIFLIIYLFLILYTSTIFTNFVKTYYLFETPIWATLSVLYAACFYVANKSEQTLIRTSLILFPISVTLIFINSALLFPLTNSLNFLPIFTNSTTNILTASLIYILCTAVPSILLLEYKVSLKTKLYSYFFVTFIILFINLFITGVLGDYLISTYSFPEYMVLRRIRFLDFIENVENFASMMWYFDIFIIITLSIIKIKKLLPQKNQNLIIVSILLFLTFLSYKTFTNYFSALDTFMKNGILFLLIFLILTCPILLIYTSFKIKKTTQINE